MSPNFPSWSPISYGGAVYWGGLQATNPGAVPIPFDSNVNAAALFTSNESRTATQVNASITFRGFLCTATVSWEGYESNDPFWIVEIGAWKSRENDSPSQTMIFFLLFEEVYDYQCHASNIYRRVGVVKNFFYDDINEPLLPNESWKEFTMM